MTAKHIILANWKMHPKSPQEAQALFTATKLTVGRLRSVELILAPPALYLHSLSSTYSGNKIEFAAQEVSLYDTGSHTGSISAEQYAASGAQYALIGHSECLPELEELRIKTFMAVKHKLTPIIFIGEHARDEVGKYLKEIKHQVIAALTELTDVQRASAILCYEPVWAVGQSEALSAYDVHAMALYLRKVLIESYTGAVARNVRVLYGGSVNASNLADILAITDLDGVAVGRASLLASSFTELLKIANKV